MRSNNWQYDNTYEAIRSYLWCRESLNEHEQRLITRTEKYLRYIRYLPGISMIAICNSIALHTAHADSDIDLFVVTKRGNLWSTRILLTLALSLLWVRRSGKDIPGNFCLSFFVTEEGMNLEKIRLPDDPYLDIWRASIIPIIAEQGIYERFLELNGYEKMKDPTIPFQPVRWHMGWWIEDIFQKIFSPRTQASYEKLGKPYGVIISEDILKFHPEDRRKGIAEELQKKNWQ